MRPVRRPSVAAGSSWRANFSSTAIPKLSVDGEQAMSLAGAIHVSPDCAARDGRGARLEVHADSVEPAHVDHQAAVGQRRAGDAVAAAADSDLELLLPCDLLPKPPSAPDRACVVLAVRRQLGAIKCRAERS